ncbi:MAG: GLUG motif-containing protein [Candidatus Cloacimonadia bacterium]
MLKTTKQLVMTEEIKRKTIITIILFALMIPVVLFGFAGGEGTIEDPYQVENAEHLNEVRDFRSSHFIQTADIDLSEFLSPGGAGFNDGKGWKPLFSIHYTFEGTYEGNNFKISNLFIDDDKLEDAGLFAGTSEDAVIRNLRLENVDITGKYVGALVNSHRGEMINCSSSGIVRGGSVGGLCYKAGVSIGPHRVDSLTNCFSECEIVGTGLAGGIISKLFNGTIQDSYAEGTVIANGEFSCAGGLISRSFSGVVDNCYATGNVTASSSAGGLIGDASSTVSNSYATGNVVLLEDNEEGNAGGLIGTHDSLSSINNVYATGSVTGKGNIGGLVGYHLYRRDINNSYAAGSVSGEGNLGGLVGYSEEESTHPTSYWSICSTGMYSPEGGGLLMNEMLSADSFTDWDFVSVWQIDEGESYPYLRTNKPVVIPRPPERENDLGIIMTSAPSFGTTGSGYNVEVLIFNLGNRTQNNFTVTLFEDDEEVMSVRASEHTLFGKYDVRWIVFPWLPENTGEVVLTASIESNNDDYLDNNHTIPHTVSMYMGFTDGDGSEENPYQVSHYQHLDYIRNELDANYIQTADIDMEGRGLIPIGGETEYGSYFTGVYDGNGYQVGNFTVDESIYEYTKYGSLFTKVGKQGVIKNLTINNVRIENGGGIAGYNRGSIINCKVTNIIPYDESGLLEIGGIVRENRGLIKDCSVESDLHAKGNIGGIAIYDYEGVIKSCSYAGNINIIHSSGYSTGGIVCNAYGSTIIDSHTSGLIEPEALYHYAGGIVAKAENNTEIRDSSSRMTINPTYARSLETGGIAGVCIDSLIENCSSNGNIRSHSTAGGIVGAALTSTVLNSFSEGNIYGGDMYTGGLIGVTSECTVKYCYSTCDVYSSGYAGGLIGKSGGYVFDCYARGNVVGNQEAGGLIGRAGFIKLSAIERCYSTGTVEGVYRAGGLVGYNIGLIEAVDCFWDIESSECDKSYAGTGKTTDEMLLQATYTNWDFTDVWRIDENRSYPYLAYQDGPVNVDKSVETLPLTTRLHGNYPNPFNPETTIHFTLSKPGKARLEIFNIKGQKVATLLDGYLQSGDQRVVWSGKDNMNVQQSSGVYFYRLTTDNYQADKRMMLLK